VAHGEFDLSEPEARPTRQMPAARYEPSAPPAPEPVKRTSLFSRVFGGSPATPQPQAAAQRGATHREPMLNAPVRAEPSYDAPPEPTREPVREPARAAVRPAQIDEIGLEIPAFLRRTNS
jgi:cell division protein FtsZ